MNNATVCLDITFKKSLKKTQERRPDFVNCLPNITTNQIKFQGKRPISNTLLSYCFSYQLLHNKLPQDLAVSNNNFTVSLILWVRKLNRSHLRDSSAPCGIEIIWLHKGILDNLKGLRPFPNMTSTLVGKSRRLSSAETIDQNTNL